MDILKEFLGNWHWVGMVLILVVLYWLWQELKKAYDSFMESDRKFHTSCTPTRVEDSEGLGVEAAWLPPQSRER